MASKAELEALRQLLSRMGILPADLVAAASDRPPAPTFAEYVPVVAAEVSAGTTILVREDVQARIGFLLTVRRVRRGARSWRVVYWPARVSRLAVSNSASSSVSGDDRRHEASDAVTRGVREYRKEVLMTNSTADFLSRLGQHRRLPITVSGKARGTIRLDVERDAGIDSWFVTLRHGTAQVSQQDRARMSRQERQPDLVIRGHQTLFDRLVQGQAQLYASLLRNEINVEGDLALLSCFERLLPGPAGAHHPRDFANEGEPGS